MFWKFIRSHFSRLGILQFLPLSLLLPLLGRCWWTALCVPLPEALFLPPCRFCLPLQDGSLQTPVGCPLVSTEAWTLRRTRARWPRTLLWSQLPGPGAGGRRSAPVFPFGLVGSPLAGDGVGGGSALLFISPSGALSSVWDSRHHCASGPRAEVPVLHTAETRLAVSFLPGRGGGSLGSRWDLRI